jgi:hypothetical protein
MAKQKSDTTPRVALLDLAQALKQVFHKHSRSARTQAWEKTQHGTGAEEIKKLLRNPDHTLNKFHSISFKEWLLETHGQDIV